MFAHIDRYTSDLLIFIDVCFPTVRIHHNLLKRKGEKYLPEIIELKLFKRFAYLAVIYLVSLHSLNHKEDFIVQH